MKNIKFEKNFLVAVFGDELYAFDTVRELISHIKEKAPIDGDGYELSGYCSYEDYIDDILEETVTISVSDGIGDGYFWTRAGADAIQGNEVF